MIVLLIEDEEEVTKLWSRFLTETSREIRVAHNLPDGLVLMQQQPHPDIVLLDLGLPGSRPRNTLEHIDTIKGINPEAVVIVITGNSEEKIMELSEQLGADFFARKVEHGTSQNLLLDAIKKGLTHVTSKQPSYTRPLDLLEKLTTKFSTK